MARIQPLFLVLAIAMWIPLAMMLAAIGGCASGSHGLLRPVDDHVYASITNGVVKVVQVGAQIAPPPFGAAAEAAGAAVLALLAAWQGMTHKRVNTLAVNSPSASNKPTP